ncbi:hypothetical protein FSB65_31030 [Paraburkholderia sp. JPY418]|nr:hypothetical protein [Paraburkholderia youngii]
MSSGNKGLEQRFFKRACIKATGIACPSCHYALWASDFAPQTGKNRGSGGRRAECIFSGES